MRIELPARPRRRIVSLVPMVDVVMNLLFFFMLAGAYTELKPVVLNLAGADAQAAKAAPPLLRVEAQAVTLDGARATLDTALGQLRQRGATVVVVQPAPGLAVQPLLTTIERLRAAGLQPALVRAAPP